MRNFWIGLAILVVALGGAAAYVVVNLNALVKDGIETVGPEVLGVPVTVETVSISLINGHGWIRGLRVGNPEGFARPYAFELEDLSFVMDSVVSFDQVHLKELIITAPAIHYEGDLRGSNLQQLQSRAAESGGGESSGDEGEEGVPIRIDHLEINNAQLGVDIKVLKEQLDLVVPQIVINDIGKNGETMPADVIAQVIRELNRNVIPLVQENASTFDIKVKEGIEKLKSLFDRD